LSDEKYPADGATEKIFLKKMKKDVALCGYEGIKGERRY
jgi:hypothetical protein